MATFKKYRWLCSLLTISILSGSCQVYQKVPVSLEEAVASNERVKIVTIDNRKSFYKNIEKTDSIYYGVEESGLELVKKPLKKEAILKIQLRNKPKSRLVTIAGVTVAVGLLAALISSGGVTTGAGPVGGF